MENSHRVAVYGMSLAEMADSAAEAFDAYFGEGVEWVVTLLVSEAKTTRLQRGDGQHVLTQVTEWEAVFEAQCALTIERHRDQPVLWFPTHASLVG